MTVAPCPLCNGQRRPRLRVCGETSDGYREPETIYACQRCGLHTPESRPPLPQLFSQYPKNYEAYWLPLEESDPIERWTRRRHLALRCHAVRRSSPGAGFVLDIGCGTGGFLRLLCEDGSWRGVGLDIGEHALAVARKQGVDVTCGEGGELPYSPATFDAITLWEVIEHLWEPRQALSEIYRVLKANGLLLMTTPNAESFQARFWGRHWCGWDVPRHLQIFTRTSINRLLKDTGFKIIRRLHFPMERYFLTESARSWLWSRNRNGAALRQFVGATALLLWPLLRLVDFTPNSSSIAVVAQKVS